MATQWKKLVATTGAIMLADFTAEGDLMAGTAPGAFDAVHIGSVGEVATVVDGTLSWEAAPLPGDHATTHKSGGADVINLQELGLADGNVAINGQEAQNLLLHKVANAAGLAGLAAVLGKIAWQTDTGFIYICTEV